MFDWQRCCFQIREFIEKYKAMGWIFAYLGANQNAEEVAESMSITNALNFRANEEDTREVFSTLANAQQRAAGVMRRFAGAKGICCMESSRRASESFFSEEDRRGRTMRRKQDRDLKVQNKKTADDSDKDFGNYEDL